MSKWIKISGGSFAALILISLGWLYFSSYYNYAAPTAEALVALRPNQELKIDYQDNLIMMPTQGKTTRGIIVYPGAYCDVRGYAPTLRHLAEQNIAVIVVEMPFMLAIFAPDAATDIIQAHPEIKQWLLVGHSIGGAMASRFAAINPELIEGLILLDSHPPASNSLADSSVPVMHIHRATTGGQIPEKFTDARYLFPRSSQWIPVPGGQHMYFGSFEQGGYQEDWPAAISRQQQQIIVEAAMNKAVNQMFSSSD